MKDFLGKLVMLAVVAAALSFAMALPLWGLWPWGAQLFGAPAISYLTFAALLGTAATVFITVYFGGRALKRACDMLFEDW